MEHAHAQASLKLIIEDDEGRRSVVPIDLGEATVGRDEDNTIRLNERNVSRRHARIVREKGQVVAEDLDSYNGVFINGDRVKQRQGLHEGDILRVGDFQLELRGEGLGRRTEETTVRAGAPGSSEITKPSIRLDESAPRDGTLRDPSDYDDEEESQDEPTAIIRADQVQRASKRAGAHEMATQPRARLICVSTQFAGREFELEREESVIGRTDDNDIAVDHRSVSRHHAKVMFTGKSFRIIDMKSANGTLVNGEEYAQIELQAGDLIELGHVKFRFVSPGEHYAFSAAELAAISASRHGQPHAPVDDLAPVAEYVPPKETTNPGVGRDAQRALPERQSANLLLYIGLGVIALLLAAVLAVLLLPDPPRPESPESGAQGVVVPSPKKSGAPRGVSDLARRMSQAVVDKDWSAASELAVTILSLDPTYEAARTVKRRADTELVAARNFEAAIELVGEEDWNGVLAAVESIPAESSLAVQAQTMKEQAQVQIQATDLITRATEALAENRYDDAEALAKQLAESDSEASEMLLERVVEKSDPGAKRVAKTKTSKSTVKKTAAGKPNAKVPRLDPSPNPDEAGSRASESAKDHLRDAIKLIREKRHQEALEPLQACVRVDPKECTCFRILGIVHANLGNSAKSTRNYRTYIEQCPDGPDVPKVKAILGIK